MDLGQLSYVGPSLDDVEILPRLPAAYVRFLASRNGFVAFGGGLHVRGAVLDPEWHSIRAALDGPSALHVLFGALTPADIPFAQDALGDQFVLRDGLVYHLHRSVWALSGADVRPLLLRRRAGRPQLKRDPLGGGPHSP